MTVALICYLGLAAVLYGFQRNLLYFPDTTKPNSSAAAVVSLQDVELVTSDGVRLLAWYVPAPRGKPMLVYFHGNGGNLEHRASRLRQFAEAGYGVLMPEYRGYGGNAGQPTEAGFYRDAVAAVTFLQSRGHTARDIIVYGESIGTGVAIRIASEQHFAAVVLESPFTSIADVARTQFWFLPVDVLVRDRFDSLSRIGRVRAPLLVLQGGRDNIVPPALGRELFAAAPGPKEYWSAAEGGHNDLFQFGAGDAVLDFLRRHVRAGH